MTGRFNHVPFTTMVADEMTTLAGYKNGSDNSDGRKVSPVVVPVDEQDNDTP